MTVGAFDRQTLHVGKEMGEPFIGNHAAFDPDHCRPGDLRIGHGVDQIPALEGDRFQRGASDTSRAAVMVNVGRRVGLTNLLQDRCA